MVWIRCVSWPTAWKSPCSVGRTRTAPENNADFEPRFAWVSCQDFAASYYGAYRRMLNEDLERVNYFGQQVRLDVQGRILIPQILRESASINGDVVVSGQLNHLVVWNHERFVSRLTEQPFTDEDFHALSTQGI